MNRIQFKPSVASIAQNDCLLASSSPRPRNGEIATGQESIAASLLEAELHEHRYYLESKVEKRTEQLTKRIALLESCNATLTDKLAKARKEIAVLRKQLANTGSSL